VVYVVKWVPKDQDVTIDHTTREGCAAGAVVDRGVVGAVPRGEGCTEIEGINPMQKRLVPQPSILLANFRSAFAERNWPEIRLRCVMASAV
jgi:hypothetical protein